MPNIDISKPFDSEKTKKMMKSRLKVVRDKLDAYYNGFRSGSYPKGSKTQLILELFSIGRTMMQDVENTTTLLVDVADNAFVYASQFTIFEAWARDILNRYGVKYELVEDKWEVSDSDRTNVLKFDSYADALMGGVNLCLK